MSETAKLMNYGTSNTTLTDPVGALKVLFGIILLQNANRLTVSTFPILWVLLLMTLLVSARISLNMTIHSINVSSSVLISQIVLV